MATPPSRRMETDIPLAPASSSYGSFPEANQAFQASRRTHRATIGVVIATSIVSLLVAKSIVIPSHTPVSSPSVDASWDSRHPRPFWAFSPFTPPEDDPKKPVDASAIQGGVELASPFPQAAHSQQPSDVWGKNVAPYPTGSWWLNLVLDPVRAVAPLPYTVNPGKDGIQICYPMSKGLMNSTNRMIVQQFSAQMAVTDHNEGYSGYTITDYDELSVTVETKTPVSTYTAYLVRGSPYISVEFKGAARPLLWSYDPIQSMRTAEDHTRIHFETGEVWAVYSYPKIKWKVTFPGKKGGGPRAEILADETHFSGWIRIAYVPKPSALKTLDAHFQTIPVSGSFDYTTSTDRADISYNFKTRDIEGKSPSQKLLMLATDHHSERMAKSQIPSSFKGMYGCMKGPMAGVLGNEWKMELKLPEARWGAERPIPGQLKGYITDALRRDVKALTDAWDVYNFTKQAARMARCALIADDLGETELRKEALDMLYASITPWLNQTKIDNSIVYDKVWGGVVTSAGLINPSSDFGNGWYNDHHFQYGYLIHAAAVLIKFKHSDFVSHYGPHILAIASDFANPLRKSSGYTSTNFQHNNAYPVARHKDFYDFHSWASGIFPMDDSKSQESSSEAVNAYYAVALLGDAFGDDSLKQWGRLLMGMEIDAAHRYWHMPSWQKVYPDESFRKHRMVGMVSATRAAYFTWFGDVTEYIHCVNMMPFTPASTYLLPKDYVKQQYPVLSTSLNRADPIIKPAWRSLVYMGLAIIDPKSAWDKIQQVSELDNGLSLSNALWFIATREGGESINAPTKKLNPESWQCQGAPVCAIDFHGTAWSCCSNPGGCCTVNPIPCCSGQRSFTPPPPSNPLPTLSHS